MVRILLLLLSIVSCTAAQPSSQDEAERARARALEDILRIQDTRSIHDGKLIRYLGDADRIVRARASLACGSLQDTTLIGLLVRNLDDPDDAVRFNAAFGIGQSAIMLSETGRQKLEHELIWVRIPAMSSPDRLIEEIGKFGTADGLKDLIVRIGNVYPLKYRDAVIMSIARFAIRRITSPEAVRYLLQFTKAPESTPWQVAYALQRMAPLDELLPEMEELALLTRNPDPLTRMNMATFLGKMNDATIAVERLVKLAEFDDDWRVRINAIRALSTFPPAEHESIIRVLKSAFLDGNEYIVLTALQAFGNSRLSDSAGGVTHDAFELVKEMALNENNQFRWQTQAEAGESLARLLGSRSLDYLKPARWPQPLLQARLLDALGETGSADAVNDILPFTTNSSAVIRRSALEALHTVALANPSRHTIVDTTYARALTALSSDDIAVITTGAGILGDSLFRRPSSVGPLLKTLGGLRPPGDVPPMIEIIAALKLLGSSKAVPALTPLLRAPDRNVVESAADALQAITGRTYETPAWIQPLLTDFDFAFLNSLPDVVTATIETSKGDIVVELYKTMAPFTVMNLVKLSTQRGFYRGSTFHRVVPNFVIQGGDPRGDGWGGPGFTIRSEFTPLTYDTGSLGMASAGKDTEGSQFFITQSPQPHLDGRYTLFGKVVSGMNVVDQIQVDDRIYDIKIQ